MKQISLLRSVMDRLYSEKKKESISYLYELVSLQNELLDIEVNFKAQYSLNFDNRKESEFNSEYVDAYFFFLKNSIYRIYDLLNKYALLINSIYSFYNVKNRLAGYTELKNNISKVNNSVIKDAIKKVRNNKSISRVLTDRTSMTHRKMVGFQEDYFSTYVLPLDGEIAKDRVKWLKQSSEILDKAKKGIDELINSTLPSI